MLSNGSCFDALIKTLLCPQICPCDCRHTLATLAAAAVATSVDNSPSALRQPAADEGAAAALPPLLPEQQAGSQRQQRVTLYVFEEEPELLARHMLLLYALLDGSRPPKERAEAFLELHGSALLRRRTADWLGARRGKHACSACAHARVLACMCCTRSCCGCPTLVYTRSILNVLAEQCASKQLAGTVCLRSI
jgi:hypothetical protein